MALPAKGESFALFQQHDMTCRAFASARNGGQTPGQVAAGHDLAGAALGTGLGAAAGALLGSVSGHAGGGAAIGGGTGLLAGSLLGGVSGRTAAAETQDRYDTAYAQCMLAHDEQIVPRVAPPQVAYRAPPVIYYGPPPAIYMPAPVYVAPPPP